jgi:hypothetical protein
VFCPYCGHEAGENDNFCTQCGVRLADVLPPVGPPAAAEPVAAPEPAVAPEPTQVLEPAAAPEPTQAFAPAAAPEPVAVIVPAEPSFPAPAPVAGAGFGEEGPSGGTVACTVLAALLLAAAVALVLVAPLVCLPAMAGLTAGTQDAAQLFWGALGLACPFGEAGSAAEVGLGAFDVAQGALAFADAAASLPAAVACGVALGLAAVVAVLDAVAFCAGLLRRRGGSLLVGACAATLLLALALAGGSYAAGLALSAGLRATAQTFGVLAVVPDLLAWPSWWLWGACAAALVALVCACAARALDADRQR